MRFTLLLALLAVLAAVIVRSRRRRARIRAESLSDEMVRQIEKAGRVEHDAPEPLDHGEIRAKEDEFWNQTWDEPEEL